VNSLSFSPICSRAFLQALGNSRWPSPRSIPFMTCWTVSGISIEAFWAFVSPAPLLRPSNPLGQAAAAPSARNRLKAYSVGHTRRYMKFNQTTFGTSLLGIRILYCCLALFVAQRVDPIFKLLSRAVRSRSTSAEVNESVHSTYYWTLRLIEMPIAAKPISKGSRS